jgi:hypothetical protein
METDEGGLYECHYCKEIFDKRRITKDHKHAQAEGGINSKKNYVPSCQPCNHLKANIPYDKFMSIIDEFTTDIVRFESPSDATNHMIVEGGLVYNLGDGKVKTSNNSDVGYGSRILTTVIIHGRKESKLYVFVSKKYGKRKEKKD